MIIKIDELTFECIIGILESERTMEQKVIVNVEIEYDYKSGFIDYALVSQHIKEVMKKHKFKLIEEAILSLQASLKISFTSINSLNLTIYKPDILPDCRVGITQNFNY
jgi:dihydroneopterin aldolase